MTQDGRELSGSASGMLSIAPMHIWLELPPIFPMTMSAGSMAQSEPPNDMEMVMLVVHAAYRTNRMRHMQWGTELRIRTVCVCAVHCLRTWNISPDLLCNGGGYTDVGPTGVDGGKSVIAWDADRLPLDHHS